MICVIIIFTLAISHATRMECSKITEPVSTVAGSAGEENDEHDSSVTTVNDVTTGSFEEKGGTVVTNDKSLRKLVNISMRGVESAERSSSPYVFRWTDGRRENGE